MQQHTLVDFRNSKESARFCCSAALHVAQNNDLALTSRKGVDTRADLRLDLLRQEALVRCYIPANWE